MAEPAPPQPTSSAAVPTTKTKLFTLGDEGTWTEIGVGVATIQYEAAIPSSDGSTTELSPKLVIESLEDDASELLLSTPLSTEDIYQVQKGTILVWTDPELARDMAASFHTAEGCRQIMDEIRRYQTENAKTHDLLGTLSENSALSEELSPWAVTKQNLPALAIAVQSNKQRFAMYFNSNTNGRDSRDDSNKNRFYADLVKLFVSSRDEGDLSTQRQIGEIVYALLSKPFSLDNRILGVLVDEDVIEWTVDIVQVHLGRVDASTGFVSTAERRAKFRDAGLFTDLMLKRCHFVAEIQTLRDLLPLQLEDGDAGNMGSLALYCLRLKYELLADVCGTTMGDIVRARDVAPHLFTESLMKFMPLLHDLCTTIKVSPLPLEPKDGLLKDAVSNGLLKLAAAAFRFYVRVSPQDEVQLVDPAASVYIIGRLADIIGSCAAFTPSATREALLGDVMSCVHAPERPPAEILPPVEREVEDRRPLVELLLAAMTASDDDVLQQSLFDALQLITVGLQATALAPTTLSAQKLKLALIRYMVSGVAVETAQSPSPLRLLLTGMRTNVASRPYAYCAKALVFVFQRLLTMDGIIGPGRELEPILHRVVGVLQNGEAPRLVLDAMTRHDVKTGSKTAALQFFASVFAPPDYHQLVGVFAEWSGLSELACVLHHSLCLGRRRQNILFGAVSSVISSLCSSLDQDPEIERQLAQPFTPVVAQIEAISRTLSVGSPSWHAEVNHVVALASLRQRRQFCSRIAKVILSVDSDRLRLANPLAFAALDAVAKDHLDADPCDAREASVQSAAVGATGSRNGFSPDGGGVADTGASPDRNPFLPHRSRSQSNEAAAPSFGRSVDEEYQALMADFDAVVPVVVASRLDLDSPHGGGDDVTPADDATTDQLDELPLKRTRSEQFSSS